MNGLIFSIWALPSPKKDKKSYFGLDLWPLMSFSFAKVRYCNPGGLGSLIFKIGPKYFKKC